jgi:hypothetical protein
MRKLIFDKKLNRVRLMSTTDYKMKAIIKKHRMEQKRIKKHTRDKERLAKITDMYYKQKMSMRAIASVFHVTKQAIWFLFKQEGLKKRPLLSDDDVNKEYQKYITDPEYTQKSHPYSLTTYIRYFKDRGLALRRERKPKYTIEYTARLHKEYMDGTLSLMGFCREHKIAVSSLSRAFKTYGLKAKRRGWDGYWERIHQVVLPNLPTTSK